MIIKQDIADLIRGAGERGDDWMIRALYMVRLAEIEGLDFSPVLKMGRHEIYQKLEDAKMEKKTKEQIYDEEINPLMAQILEICKRHKIPMLATFSTPSEDDPGLFVTSFLLDPEWGTPSEFAEAARVIKPPTVFMAFTVSKT